MAKDNHKNNNWRKPKLQLGFSGIYFSDLVANLLNMISLNLPFLYKIEYIWIFVYIEIVFYQFLKTGTSDITFMVCDQELK